MMYKLYLDYCTRYRFTPFNKDGFESRIVVDNSGITLCTSHGYDCYKFNKKVYEAWIGKYKKLDGDIEDIKFDDENDNMAIKRNMDCSTIDDKNNLIYADV